MNNIQAPNTVVMVRPHHFMPNPQTAGDNAYQISLSQPLDALIVARTAYEEVSQVANKLRSLGVDVMLFDDTSNQTPDSVFPNNWFSTHSDGNLYLYPMYAGNRRLERRSDIIERLQTQFAVNNVVDLSVWEHQQQFLEGTGAMVLDHQAKFAYVCRSMRAHQQPLSEFCAKQALTPVIFSAQDSSGTDVYHTNVLMAVTTDFVIIGDEMIKDQDERERVTSAINQSGKQLISLSEQQIEKFAGNMLELSGNNKRFIALSSTAYSSLTAKQKTLITSKVDLVQFNIPTIELAGGSIRCMLAGIHLPKSTDA